MTWVLVWLIYASVIIAFVLMVWRMTEEGKNMNYGPYDSRMQHSLPRRKAMDKKHRKALADTLRSEPDSFVIGLSFMALIEALTNDYNLNSIDRWIDHIPDPRASEYRYAAGDRLETDLTLISYTKYEHSSWNGRDTEGTIYTFIDSSGNYYKWFTDSVLILKNNNDSVLDIYPRPGDTCHVRATVKKLSEYRGRRETILSRVRVVSVDRASVNVALNL